MEGWDLTSRLFQSGPYSGSKMFEINRLVNSVSNWKTLTGKEVRSVQPYAIATPNNDYN